MSKSQGTRITWLGHATVLIQTAQGTNILIDPFIAHNPKYPKDFVLPAKIDYVLLTHGHGDHISDAAPVAKKHDSTVVAIYELADYIAGQGVTKTMGMNLGGSAVLNDVTATMVDAKHSAGAATKRARTMWAWRPASCSLSPEGRCFTTRAILRLWRHALIRELYQPSVVMLPIGGYYTMDPKEAAVACRLLAPETVLPIHWGTFPPLTGTPAELAALVGAGVKVVDWKPGDEISV